MIPLTRAVGKRPVAAPSGWSPLDEPSLRAWYDASDPSVFTLSGNEVTQWRDKSPSANHLAPVAAINNPTRTASQNGRSVVTFGANGKIIESAPGKPSSPIGASGALTVITAFIRTGNSSYDAIPTEIGSPGTNGGTFTGYYEGRQTTGASLAGAPGNSVQMGVLNGWHVLTHCVVNVVGYREWLDGALLGTGNAFLDISLGGLATQRILLASRADYVTQFIGNIAESMIFDGNADVMRLNAEAYLKARWATP